VEQWLGVRLMLSNERLVIQMMIDKIETCRSVVKCFKSVLCEIICAFVG